MADEGSLGYERRMLAAHGLRPTSGNPHWPCPRVAAAKRCLRGYPSAAQSGCICEDLYPSPLDHGRTWLDENSRYVVTAEPYDHPDLAGELDRLNATISPLGLEAVAIGGEQWKPGHTVLVWIQGVTPANRRDH